MLANDGYISGLFSIPGFDYDYIGLDFMHIADLGVSQYLVGGVLFTLFRELGGRVTRPKPT